MKFRKKVEETFPTLVFDCSSTKFASKSYFFIQRIILFLSIENIFALGCVEVCGIADLFNMSDAA